MIGAAKYKTHSADEVLDVLQNEVIEQLKKNRSLNGVVRFSEVGEMRVDNFMEITKNHKGALLQMNVKYSDTPSIPDTGYIEEILGMEVTEG